MSFKTVAFEILKYAKEPLHIKEIVKRAKQKRMLETAGETPELPGIASLPDGCRKSV